MVFTRGIKLGTIMKRLVLLAALALVALQPAAVEARDACYTRTAMEADQAIRFMTDVMVISSACQDTVYAEFRLRNRVAIIGYQRAMIAHFHSTSRFDEWNTHLANEVSMKDNGVPTAKLCQESKPILAKASSLDTAGFRAYAAAQATSASAQYDECGGGRRRLLRAKR